MSTEQFIRKYNVDLMGIVEIQITEESQIPNIVDYVYVFGPGSPKSMGIIVYIKHK